jgi:hypothetical protein
MRIFTKQICTPETSTKKILPELERLNREAMKSKNYVGVLRWNNHARQRAQVSGKQENRYETSTCKNIFEYLTDFTRRWHH